MVIIDTSTIIDHLRQKDGATTALFDIVRHHGMANLAISIITIQELYRGESTRNTKKEELLLATISPLRTLPYSYEVAKLAGKIGRDSKRPLAFADAAIAATAIINEATLHTLNTRDFAHIPELELLKN